MQTLSHPLRDVDVLSKKELGFSLNSVTNQYYNLSKATLPFGFDALSAKWQGEESRQEQDYGIFPYTPPRVWGKAFVT